MAGLVPFRDALRHHPMASFPSRIGFPAWHRAFARTLITEWIGRSEPRIAQSLPVRANRMKAAVLSAPFLLAGAAQSFRGHFFHLMARDATALSVASARPEERLRTTIAFAY